MLTTIERYPANLKPEHKQLGKEPLIHDGACVYQSKIGSWTEIGSGSKIIESTFDDYSYDAGDVSIIYADVGKFCSIASHVRINPGNHPMHRVTQHHCTYRLKQFGFAEKDDEKFFDWRRSYRCKIGHDVWIGHGATIMPGIKIGTGSVIGSGAVVTKDIDNYTIAVGVPAKPIRKRFDDRTIEKLLSTKWWDWDRKILEERFADLYDMNLFLEKWA